MRFEWDEKKRAANVAKHGLDLVEGIALFDGRSVVTYASPRDNEQRFVTVGILVETFLAVIWTERDEVVRLISLRRARDGERREYHARFG